MTEGTGDEGSVDEAVASASTSQSPPRASASHRRHLHPARRHQALVRLSDHEHDLIATAAARSGLRLASWIGRAALAAARETVSGERPAGTSAGEAALQADLHAELIAARHEVRAIGVNLNQAVARFNALGEPPASLEVLTARVEAAVERLEQAAVAARIPRR